MAELEPEVKAAISHRGRAARALVAAAGGLASQQRPWPSAPRSSASSPRPFSSRSSWSPAWSPARSACRGGSALGDRPRRRAAHALRHPRRHPPGRRAAPLRPRQGRAPRRAGRVDGPHHRLRPAGLAGPRPPRERHPPEVDATWWAFVVLGIVIVVDASRATLSLRAAREHHSPALESNALHFGTDLLGTVAVVIGLILVAAGEPRADAIAALIVAVIVFFAASRLIKRAIDVLMDRASEDSERAVREALGAMPGIDVRRLRIRQAAGRDFVDLVVALSADAGLAQAHTTADAIEDAVEDVLAARTSSSTSSRAPSRATCARRRRSRPCRSRTSARSTTCASCRSTAATSCRCTSSCRAGCRSPTPTRRSSSSRARCGRRCPSCGWSTRTSSR